LRRDGDAGTKTLFTIMPLASTTTANAS